MKKRYSDELRCLFLKLLENDIDRFSKQFYIYNFDKEDIAQELRLFIWTYDYLYDPYKASVRTWGCRTLRSGLTNLYNAHYKTNKRKANVLKVEFDDEKEHDTDEE